MYRDHHGNVFFFINLSTDGSTSAVLQYFPLWMKKKKKYLSVAKLLTNSHPIEFTEICPSYYPFLPFTLGCPPFFPKQMHFQ